MDQVKGDDTLTAVNVRDISDGTLAGEIFESVDQAKMPLIRNDGGHIEESMTVDIPSTVVDKPEGPQLKRARPVLMNGRYPLDVRDEHDHSKHGEDTRSMARPHDSVNMVKLSGLFRLSRDKDLSSKIPVPSKLHGSNHYARKGWNNVASNQVNSTEPLQASHDAERCTTSARPAVLRSSSLHRGVTNVPESLQVSQPFQKRSLTDLYWTSEHRRLRGEHDVVTKDSGLASPIIAHTEKTETASGQDSSSHTNIQHEQVVPLEDKVKSTFVRTFEDFEEFKRTNYTAKESRSKFKRVVEELEDLTTEWVPVIPSIGSQEVAPIALSNSISDESKNLLFNQQEERTLAEDVTLLLDNLMGGIVASLNAVEEQVPMPAILVSSPEGDDIKNEIMPLHHEQDLEFQEMILSLQPILGSNQSIDNAISANLRPCQKPTILPSTNVRLEEEEEDRATLIPSSTKNFWEEADALLEQSYEIAHELGIAVPKLFELLPMTSSFYPNWFFDYVESDLTVFELKKSIITTTSSPVKDDNVIQIPEWTYNQAPTSPNNDDEEEEEDEKLLIQDIHHHHIHTDDKLLARHTLLQNVFNSSSSSSTLPTVLPLCLNTNHLAYQMLMLARRRQGKGKEDDAVLVRGMLWVMDTFLVREREEELKKIRMERMGWV